MKKLDVKNVISAKFLLTDQKLLTCKQGKMIFYLIIREGGRRQAPDQIHTLTDMLYRIADF